MFRFFSSSLFARLLGGFVLGLFGILVLQPMLARAAEPVVLAPVPAVDAPATRKLETAVFAGGCFWGVEGVFAHVNGVKLAVSGYTGGTNAGKITYDTVSTGRTGNAEAVRVTYDPAKVSYATLLRVFFSVIANPTELNFQGPDHGSQYRSALFPLNPGQEKAASGYLVQLDKSGVWDGPIVTKVERFTRFHDAEDEHQNFMARHPDHGYIRAWDAPKVAALKRLFPDIYVEKTAG